jgi:hypothetical protein
MNIRAQAVNITATIAGLYKELGQLQETCTHETSAYSPKGSSGGWDRDSYYWYECHCYDCRKSWTVDQSVGKAPCKLKVERVDYLANPEKIALLIKVEECR